MGGSASQARGWALPQAGAMPTTFFCMNISQLDPSWQMVLKNEFDQPYFQDISTHLDKKAAEGKAIYPPSQSIFNAFNAAPFEQIKVIILGQDPYHNPGQAMGLSFSVPKGERIPPSLRNIYKELADDIDFNIPQHGDLTAWTKQGVFLLNAMLTVEQKSPGSHKKIGWQNFTDATIQALSTQREHLVFMLWGAFAQNKDHLIDNQKHLVLKSAHPSPFSAHKGFLGNKHFSKANTYLKNHNLEQINWQLED